jgi:hypothetical protein
MLAKNFLAKRRTPTGTFFEILSPVLIMLVLVSADTLSEVVREEATQYDTSNASDPRTMVRFGGPGSQFVDR